MEDKEHLQISVVDSLAVAIVHTVNKLLEIFPGFSFTESSTVNLRMLPFCCMLENRKMKISGDLVYLAASN